LVLKKNEDWSPCGEYRKLNTITQPDCYPIPFPQDCVQFLHGATIFSTIDLIRVYQQIPVKEEDIPKTAIIIPFGLYEFPFMTFGLRNAAQTFQRFMDEVVRGLDFCYVYLDDILVASKTAEEHYEHLRRLFQLLQQFGVAINTTKCVFRVSEVSFLGHRISRKGLTPSPQKVETIVKFPEPKDIKGLRRVLGMINFYHRFLPNIANTQVPLQEILKGQKKGSQSSVDWTTNRKTAFKKAKDELANATLLAFPNPSAQFAVQTDASGSAIGAVLQHRQGQGWRSLSFFSRRLTLAQCNYSAYDRELLAIYATVKHFRFMLEGRKFSVIAYYDTMT